MWTWINQYGQVAVTDCCVPPSPLDSNWTFGSEWRLTKVEAKP